jgi:DNA-binding response OmpR family regulator
MASALLAGLRILIVEDEPIIALGISETIVEAGGSVIGPVHTVSRALSLIGNIAIDAAVLDYRLENETALPIAELLLARDIPFLFHTSSRGTPQKAYPCVPILDKPTQPEVLVAEIRALIDCR